MILLQLFVYKMSNQHFLSLADALLFWFGFFFWKQLKTTKGVNPFQKLAYTILTYEKFPLEPKLLFSSSNFQTRSCNKAILHLWAKYLELWSAVVMNVHTHTCTHMGLIISCLGLHNSNSAFISLAYSTNIRHISLKCKLVRQYFKFCSIWQKSSISSQQRYITSDGFSFNYSINPTTSLFLIFPAFLLNADKKCVWDISHDNFRLS